jgi:hypothetical protein
MSLDEQLSEAWGLLERIATKDVRMRPLAGWERRSVQPGLALDYLGRRHLLIPSAEREFAEDRRSAGIQIVKHELEEDGEQRIFVDVVCLKPHLAQLFDILVIEILTELDHPSVDPRTACHVVLDRWREFLDREAADQSGPEKTAGMFAELSHLRELAGRTADPLSLWTGPHGSRHDFTGASTSMEVKATLTRHGRFFEISSHDQLEPPVEGRLYLATMKLEQAASGTSIPELVDGLVELGVDRHQLLSLIAMAGMRPSDADSNTGLRFRIAESRIYLVDDGFPALTSSRFVDGRLPAGVLRLRYLIDLTSEPPLPLTDDEVFAVYQELVELAR